MIGTAAVALLIGTGAASAQIEQRKPQTPTEQINKSDSVQLKSDQSAQSKKPKAGAKTTGQAGANVKVQKNDANTAQPKSSAETTGQAGASSEMQKNGQKSPAPQTQSGAGASGAATTTGQNGAKGSNASSASSSSSAVSATVNLTPAQKTKIRQTVIETKSAPKVAHVDFSLTTGRVIPRTIRLAPVPIVLVEVRPEWRGYEYFVVGDEIVVVNPRTMQIVAIFTV